MRLARMAFLVAFVGFCGVAARADDTSGPVADPLLHVATPDPTCDPGNCVDLMYTGTPGVSQTFFFAAVPPVFFQSFSCEVTDTQVPPPTELPTCQAIFPVIAFFGIELIVPDPTLDETFSFTASGGPIDLSPPPPGSDLVVTAGSLNLDPTPEPSTALLFITGLLLLCLAGFARKRFRAGIVA
jgi:hypothetical protein